MHLSRVHIAERLYKRHPPFISSRRFIYRKDSRLYFLKVKRIANHGAKRTRRLQIFVLIVFLALIGNAMSYKRVSVKTIPQFGEINEKSNPVRYASRVYIGFGCLQHCKLIRREICRTSIREKSYKIIFVAFSIILKRLNLRSAFFVRVNLRRAYIL